MTECLLQPTPNGGVGANQTAPIDGEKRQRPPPEAGRPQPERAKREVTGHILLSLHECCLHDATTFGRLCNSAKNGRTTASRDNICMHWKYGKNKFGKRNRMCMRGTLHSQVGGAIQHATSSYRFGWFCDRNCDRPALILSFAANLGKNASEGLIGAKQALMTTPCSCRRQSVAIPMHATEIEAPTKVRALRQWRI